jgi:hypothetical protein
MERMMGLEPTTFCMASASDRSHPFATVRSNRLFSAFPIGQANGSEPERTPNLAILATVTGTEFSSVSLTESRRRHDPYRLTSGRS